MRRLARISRDFGGLLVPNKKVVKIVQFDVWEFRKIKSEICTNGLRLYDKVIIVEFFLLLGLF